MGWRHRERLQREAGALAAGRPLPMSNAAWERRREVLSDLLKRKLHLAPDPTPADFKVHRTVAREGYRMDLVSYASGSPDIRVTAVLYVPEGDGPFPGVLNLHGHWPQGKLAARIQERGHVLAQNGFVVLSPDAPGSGERSVGAEDFRYHGGMTGAGLYLLGDSLVGWQVRDNRRSIDVLSDLPFVDADRIGVTGASGGGNQTMWISACDERVRVCVPVVSAGSFEAYVTRRNCICETLPGGLTFMEEWELLGLMAPKPVLLMNAYKDSSPAFGPEPVTRTAQLLRELYALFEAGERFDARIFNAPHGYWPEMLSAMLGWMKYWLRGEGPGFALTLPPVEPVEEARLRVFTPDAWPERTQSYFANKETLRKAFLKGRTAAPDPDRRRHTLARCAGYVAVERAAEVEECDTPGPGRCRSAVMMSPRGIPLPLTMREGSDPNAPVELIFGADGKAGTFAGERFEAAAAAVTTDLPGLGELAWEAPEPVVGGASLHDTARACLWLGYTLAGEWAECIAAQVRWAAERFPGRALRLVADREAALAALLAAALDPVARGCEMISGDLPASAVDYFRATEGSMAAMIPGLLAWGDLDQIRQLAQAAEA